MQCTWCEDKEVQEATKTCYWVMPDGKDYVEILQIPAKFCKSCGTYLTDEMNQEIDNHLYMKDLSEYSNKITYKDLLDAPVKNIFALGNQT
ncbi:YokU family protein [Alkalihalobacillus sp. BA299]|uniref:YokU family protein n=1 Tax=Alkalihalobacillus sp. BA299 TaxID=2815938 RepID=UPI001ADAE5DE|nr:YokU family protein [Alkalihalobacillus sp. BA299]